MKKIFLTWAPYSARSNTLAQNFKAEIIYIFPKKLQGNILKTLIRYIWSLVLTWRVLLKYRPNVIFSVNSPPPLILTIYIFTRLFGGEFILDSHSAPFNNPKLKKFRPIYRFFASKALLNFNTNEYHKKLVESWGGRSIVISDIPIEFNNNFKRFNISENTVAYVASFDFDEPIEEVIKAAKSLPDVRFHITGNHSNVSKQILRNAPPNIIFEGFLPRTQYLGLLASSKAVMTLTTRNFTMQRGGYEALSLERPIITSDWPVLRHSFAEGAVYVNNTAESICHGVCEILENNETYAKAIIKQRIKRKENFNLQRNLILRKLEKLDSIFNK